MGYLGSLDQDCIECLCANGMSIDACQLTASDSTRIHSSIRNRRSIIAIQQGVQPPVAPFTLG